MVIKSIDRQGRLVIPKEWRDQVLVGDKVIMLRREDSIEIKSFEGTDLTQYFDSVEMNIESDMSDWHSVKRELTVASGIVLR